MKTINIKGREYVTVNERLKAFRSQFKDYALIGRIIEQTEDSVIFEAQVINDKGIIVANGFARETTQKGGVNKFAMYENAETSAWGRALGNFGIGIDTSVCSAEELTSKLEYEENEELPEAILNALESVTNANELNEIYKRERNNLNEKQNQILINICKDIKSKLSNDYNSVPLDNS